MLRTVAAALRTVATVLITVADAPRIVAAVLRTVTAVLRNVAAALRTFAGAEDRSWEYINRSQIHECGKWETEHYNSVLEITRPHSFISGNT